MRFAISLLICLGWLLSSAQAGAESPATLSIERTLSLGPLPVSTTHFADSAKTVAMRRQLVMQLTRGAEPASGRRHEIFGQSQTWSERALADGAVQPGLSVWTVTLETDRFVRGKLEVAGLRDVEVWREGAPLARTDGAVALHLPAGSTRLWILHGGSEGDEPPVLNWVGRAAHDQLSVHLRPEQRVSARRLTNAETVTGLGLSPDGRYLALSFASRNDEADLDLRRTEIRELGSGRIVRQWTGTPPRALAWSPDSAKLAVQEGEQLWLHDMETGAARLLARHEHIGSWRWHPAGGSILFGWTDPYQPDNAKRRRFRSLEDRWANFRDNSQLFELDVTSGLIRPLTARETSLSLHDVHPDGDRVLVSERLIDYREPPHALFRLFEIDLDSLEEREVGQYRLFNGALFADEGYWLLAGPGLAQGDGATTDERLIPNEYDTQLYALSADGQRARSVSRDFDPAFGSMHRLPDGDLLLSATRGEQVVLVRFERRSGAFREVATGLEVMEQFVASEGRRPVVVVRGTDADAPQRVHRIELARNRPEVLIDTRESEYADVVFGAVRPWSFTNAGGLDIEGRYYLPPDFDADQVYPLIVYYYGGTTPVNRQFTGRYPFHLWAAKGYVVYVLQPRGTIGYGQELSALHVNAWGRYTADDIIEGTQRFVAAHGFVDGERIGNIGASYGGFMTMHLATLTDLFAAAISHAGISAITSYWGQGWWGYGYSGIASRGSFPWNNRDLYVGQSPVYHADRINTPLLLVTGDSDTNVPPGESHNMFTALKLLGREVELIEFPGEDHWIIDREQRYVWWDTMLAWFDKWLKDEPEWWHHLYPETAPSD
ncbi:MAG: prolyl oligopeptidase family serine peptidase [Wenzhouxiangella sp.]